MSSSEKTGNFDDSVPENVVFKERKRWTFFGIPFTFTTYSLGNKSLIIKRGFFTTYEDEILLFRVMDVTLRRTLGQKIFGLGTLNVISTDKTNPSVEIKNIKNVRKFKDSLSERVESERLRMRFKAGEIMGVDIDEESQQG